jgi:hypothetical protein
MDCSINESAIVPTTSTRSQPIFSSTVPIRNLLDCSNDQLIPIENQPVEYSDHSTEVRNKIDSSLLTSNLLR